MIKQVMPCKTVHYASMYQSEWVIKHPPVQAEFVSPVFMKIISDRQDEIHFCLYLNI